ncbi:MAG TPA: NADH:flavin oxidoreductase [Deltaproteobacteria bacterium]|nr:NADH:flavin oxidoreductase [Deltaproteobacteria bacterium]
MAKLFEDSTISGVTLRNRVIRTATHEGLGDKEGRPMPDLTDLYLRLARGGVGAIITGYAAVQKNGRTMLNMRMFDRDELIEDYRKMNTQLDELGVPIINQIAHGGGQTSKRVIGEQPAAPTKRKYPLFSSTARELSDNEIEEIINSFVSAVERSRRAGFSGVQLHAAHGYLLNEFLSPHLNMRNDRWGGSLENRFRIVAEIMRRSREKVGSYPILAKISAYDGEKNGIRIDEGVKIAEAFQKSGCDAIEVSCGGSEDGFNATRVPKVPMDAALALIPWWRSLPRTQKILMRIIGPLVLKRNFPLYNFNVDAATHIKANVDIPVIVVGGIRRLRDMENIISEKKADYVSMCRPFIIEPDIVNKFRSGTQDESKCINCGFCLMGVTGAKVRCYYGKIRPPK